MVILLRCYCAAPGACACRLYAGLGFGLALSPIIRTFANSSLRRHARERFEQRGNLRRHLGHVAGDLVHAGGVAVAGGDDGDLVHVGQRRGQRPDDLRHAGDQLVDDGRLVEFLVSLGLHVHGLGFGFALLEDDFGFGFALRADRRGVAFGFHDQALLLGFGQGLDALALELGLLSARWRSARARGAGFRRPAP